MRPGKRLAVLRQRIVARIRVRFVYPKRWREYHVDIHLRLGQRSVRCMGRGKRGAVFSNPKVAKIMAALAILFAVLVVISIFQTVHA